MENAHWIFEAGAVSSRIASLSIRYVPFYNADVNQRLASRPGANMPTVNYRDPAGVNHAVQVPIGETLMEGAVRHKVPGMQAECGGNLSCATCHVYIDEAWIDRVGPAEAGSYEYEMLDNVSADRLPSSRLSCQVLVSAEMDGVAVRIAPRQT
jgi:2Fe-2S ferredoxin